MDTILLGSKPSAHEPLGIHNIESMAKLYRTLEPQDLVVAGPVFACHFFPLYRKFSTKAYELHAPEF